MYFRIINMIIDYIMIFINKNSRKDDKVHDHYNNNNYNDDNNNNNNYCIDKDDSESYFNIPFR